MADNLTTLSQHHEFYKTSKTMTCINKETYSAVYSKDTVDGYYENGHSLSKFSSSVQTSTSLLQEEEFSNGKEKKSFIEQRVERLYGPGALAQGFFINKKINSEQEFTEKEPIPIINDTYIMKQSSSSPTLPVLRHLRPEFRAQLPVVVKSRRSSEMQKSSTLPTLKEQINGQTVNNSRNNCLNTSEDISKTVEKDGHYFLKILEQETERLLLLADNCEEELKNIELCEDVVGKIRSASGKARLLVSQKMQQFKGLCTNNITQAAGQAFPTTNEDLQGFWDMVMLQVNQVDALFAEIKALKVNNWEIPTPVEDISSSSSRSNGVKARRVTNRAKPSAVNEEARKQREAERKKLIEARRKAMKAQNGAAQKNIEIFVPESS